MLRIASFALALAQWFLEPRHGLCSTRIYLQVMKWISRRIRLWNSTWQVHPNIYGFQISSKIALLLVDRFGKLVLLHNHSYLHKSILCDESKVLGLVGNGEQVDIYCVDPVSGTNPLEFVVPAWRDLKGSQSEADVNSFTVPEQNPTLVRCKTSMWIPHWY